MLENQSFDSNHPGRHALPRIYPEDGWTSSDEDTMTCFVIWRSSRKSFFRAPPPEEDGRSRSGTRARTRTRLQQVPQLGRTGKSIVFKTRSRAERDHWVMSIGMEIERLQQSEVYRVSD